MIQKDVGVVQPAGALHSKKKYCADLDLKGRRLHGDPAAIRYVCHVGWKDLGHILGAGKEEEAKKLGKSIL